MIAEYTVPWVAVENPHGPGLAARWITSKDAPAASSGSCTWSGLVATKQDDELNLAEIEELLNKVASGMGKAQNRVRHTMNGFVIAAGVYVKPLSAKALAAARSIGEVSVDMGGTACKVPLAAAEIQKAATAGRVGKKRKTIRC